MPGDTHVNSPVHDIPELPVLIPLTVAVIAVLLWQLHRRGSLTPLRGIVSIAACIYGMSVLKEVLQPFQVGFYAPRLGWRAFIHLTPLAGAEASCSGSPSAYRPLAAWRPPQPGPPRSH
jgi:hypothetical protein